MHSVDLSQLMQSKLLMKNVEGSEHANKGLLEVDNMQF